MPITFNSVGGFLAGTISSSGGDIFITSSTASGSVNIGQQLQITGSQIIEKDENGIVRNRKTFNADGTITQEKFNNDGLKATTKIRNPQKGIEVRRSGSATENQIEFSQNNAGALIVVSGSNPGFTAFMNDVGDRGIRARGDVFTSGSSNPQICSTGVAMDGSPLDYYIQMNHIGALGLTHTFGDSNGTGFLMVSQSGDTRVSKNLIVDGGITATSLNVTHFTSSIITSSTIQTEGSNIFGDTNDDTHLFNGHITASGNISMSGDLHLYGNKIYGDSDNNTYIDFGGSANTIDLYSSGRNQVNVEFSQIIFNDAGNDVDVMMKSDNNSNMFRLDAARDKIGIGTNPTDNSATLQVNGDLKTNSHITASGNISSSGVGTFDSLDIAGAIDVDGLTNLDIVDIDGAATFQSRTVFEIGTFTNGDTTPDVRASTIFKTANLGATTITGFDNGTEGQIIHVVLQDNNTDFTNGTNLILFRGLNYTSGQTNDILSFLCLDGTKWLMLNAQDNS